MRKFSLSKGISIRTGSISSFSTREAAVFSAKALNDAEAAETAGEDEDEVKYF